MQILGRTNSSSESLPATGLEIDLSNIITQIASVKEARALPRGSIVGDLHGGLTFSDAIAAALESRSLDGWREVQAAQTAEAWTIIRLDK